MQQGSNFTVKDGEACAGKGSECRCGMPQVTFSTVVMSLYSSALVQLGEMADPVTGRTGVDLDLAKQTVDMLIMIQDKTKGNLTADEEKLIQGVLHELRLAYVKAKR